MKPAIGILCIVASIILGLWPDLKKMYNKQKSKCK